MTKLRGRAALAFFACSSTALAAGIQVFSEETPFQQAIGPVITESFDQFPVGFSPDTALHLGNVTVLLTAGSVQIIGPGPFGFTTNFLSEGVQDGANNVLINFPAGTVGAGFKLVSVFPVTLTASAGSGETTTVSFSASEVSFRGFVSDSGITQTRISSPAGTGNTPIVNVGDISYGAQPPPTPTATPRPVPGDPNCGEVGFLACPTSSKTAALTSADCPLGDGSYYDLFQFAGTIGQTVTIRMTASFDTFLFLLDPTGLTLATDDDSGEGTNSLLTFTLPSTGQWQIVANSFEPNQFGPYLLSLTCSGGVGQTATPLGGAAPADIPALSFPALLVMSLALAAIALALLRKGTS